MPICHEQSGNYLITVSHILRNDWTHTSTPLLFCCINSANCSYLCFNELMIIFARFCAFLNFDTWNNVTPYFMFMILFVRSITFVWNGWSTSFFNSDATMNSTNYCNSKMSMEKKMIFVLLKIKVKTNTYTTRFSWQIVVSHDKCCVKVNVKQRDYQTEEWIHASAWDCLMRFQR